STGSTSGACEPAQVGDLGLELEHALDAGEVEACVQELPDPDQPGHVVLAVAPGAARRAVRGDQTAALVDPEVLDAGAGQLGGDRDRVERVATGAHRASSESWSKPACRGT